MSAASGEEKWTSNLEVQFSYRLIDVTSTIGKPKAQNK